MASFLHRFSIDCDRFGHTRQPQEYTSPMPIIDSDVVNNPYSAANTAVPAEFASCLAVERFIYNVGCNRTRLSAS